MKTILTFLSKKHTTILWANLIVFCIVFFFAVSADYLLYITDVPDTLEILQILIVLLILFSITNTISFLILIRENFKTLDRLLKDMTSNVNVIQEQLNDVTKDLKEKIKL